MDFVVILLVLQLLTVLGCQNHQHDFREEGFSVISISVQSSVKWITKGKSTFLGITVSLSKDQGAVEINKRASAVTVCTKCRMATGMVFMTLEQLNEIAVTTARAESSCRQSYCCTVRVKDTLIITWNCKR